MQAFELDHRYHVLQLYVRFNRKYLDLNCLIVQWKSCLQWEAQYDAVEEILSSPLFDIDMVLCHSETSTQGQKLLLTASSLCHHYQGHSTGADWGRACVHPRSHVQQNRVSVMGVACVKAPLFPISYLSNKWLMSLSITFLERKKSSQRSCGWVSRRTLMKRDMMMCHTLRVMIQSGKCT